MLQCVPMPVQVSVCQVVLSLPCVPRLRGYVCVLNLCVGQLLYVIKEVIVC